MTAIEKVLSIAANEDGYLEKSKEAYKADPGVLDSKTDGAGSDNYTKYARDLWTEKYFNASKQGVAWCAVFASWCYWKAFGKEIALKLQCQPAKNNCGAGCTSAANYYKNNGQFHYGDPKAGDQIFFHASDGNGYGHTGIVEKVSGTKVFTIEGNTSAGSSVIANGGAVCHKSYVLSNSRIAGYGRPDWSIVEGNWSDNSKEEETMAEYTARVTAASGSSVNLRKSASLNAAIVKRVPVGDPVIVKAEKNDTWAQVQYNNTIGYMQRQYLVMENADDAVQANTGAVSRNEFEALIERVNQIEQRLGM